MSTPPKQLSDHLVIRDAIMTQLTASTSAMHPPLSSAVKVFPIDSRSDYEVKLFKPPAVGIGFARRQWEPRQKAIGVTMQNLRWTWEIYVCAPGPGPGVPAGLDVFSLLQACVVCLRGLSFPSVVAGVAAQVSGGFMDSVDESLVELLPGALVYLQRWTVFQQGT